MELICEVETGFIAHTREKKGINLGNNYSTVIIQKCISV
jgi:hypothetical protein